VGPVSHGSGAPEEADVNRRYFVHYVRSVAPPGATVLDYGCGAGAMVRMLRAAGYEAYGADVRWAGADATLARTRDLSRAGTLRYFEEGGRLPFDTGTFDVVVSNQVFEHVVPMAAAVREIERVLKPTGVMYHHFPSREVLREGHIGIPLAHRLPRGSLRLYYTTALRRLGVGTFKDARSARAWAVDKLDWLDRWTVYRSRAEIHATLGRRAVLRNREIDYCRFRAGERAWLRATLARPRLKRPAEALFRRLAFEAIEARPRLPG
jgi:SAM-dependent methyltransferase